MAPFSRTATFVALLAIVRAALPTMRREIGPSGDVSEYSESAETPPDVQVDATVGASGNADIDSMVRGQADGNSNDGINQKFDADGDDLGIDYCNYDFPLGEVMAHNCTGDAPPVSSAECKVAAEMAGAGTNPDYTLQYDWYMKHPKGCFKERCDTNPHGVCYFYNPSPTEPDSIIDGTPICRRPKLVNGTKNTNGECPKGYAPITSGAKCMEFGACLGYCIGHELRIDIRNASLYDQYPKGCFIHKVDGCVYFNNPIGVETGEPKHPVGTPICNVTSITHYPESGHYP